MNDLDREETPARIELVAPPRHLANRLAGFVVRLRRVLPDVTDDEAIMLVIELGLDAAETPEMSPNELHRRLVALRH